MAPETSAKASQAEFDVIQNRIALALAKRESLVKSWNTSSRTQEPTKTEEELDAEDALHFRREPPNLGVGAPIPSHFLVSEAQQNNKSLRAKFFPMKGLKASKTRDAEEKAASAKRAKRGDSSDEEEGRSALGKAKKQKINKYTAPVVESAPGNSSKTRDNNLEEQDSVSIRGKEQSSRIQHKLPSMQETKTTTSASEPHISSRLDDVSSKASLLPAPQTSPESESHTKDAGNDGDLDASEGGSKTATSVALKRATANLSILSAVIDPAEAKKIKDKERKKRKREKKRQKDALLKAAKV
ncbi:hypothetical protein BP5796_01003 [Coleophoma crateriformis]|uniref:Uncharacterized protein n=1 Tax=Coleophoma crateriformis TaxID=565419 RepID=A0A3D8T9L0_9HELO|nr:hypothetical protein BP5796_01003 [Coleophoma crateriformis]